MVNIIKKLLVSLFIIVAFVIYTSFKNENQQEIAVLPPPKNNQIIPAVPTTTSTREPVTSAPVSASTPTPAPTKPVNNGQYKDGSYTGPAADAFYGNIQVQAVISGGKITAVNFLQYPNDRETSIMINTQAMPYLQQEAIQAQSGNVNIVSGATDTSRAFIESLNSALTQAK